MALAGPGGVAMIHCGWRGLAAGIVERGVDEVEAQAAAVGPGIGPCCYEVGDEVLAAFEPLGPGVAEGRMLDLRRGGPAPARAGRGRVGGGLRGVHELPAGALLLAPSRRRANGPPGGLVWCSDEVADGLMRDAGT